MALTKGAFKTQGVSRNRKLSHAHRVTYLADNREHFEVGLVAVEGDGLKHVPHQDEVLERGEGVDVDVGVDEGHTTQVGVLQLPDIDLHTASNRMLLN